MNTNKLLAVIVLTLSVGMFAFSTKKEIEIVKAKVNFIENELSTYTKIVNQDDSMGLSNSFFKNDEIKKISVQMNEGKIIKQVVWYFENDQLIFSEQKWENQKDKTIVNNEKIYLIDHKLIAWIRTDGKLVKNNSQEFKNMESMSVAYAEGLVQTLEE